MTSTPNKFKNSEGVRYTQGLFYESAVYDRDSVLYTLKDTPHMGFPSIHEIYLSLNDPTEYRIATEYFDGVDHWEQIIGSTWFKPHLAKMRKALELKIRSEALAEVIKDAKSGSKSSMSSAKFILEKFNTTVSPDRRKAGRPTKAEVAAEANKLATSSVDIADDFSRIANILKPESIQ